jgi:transposase
MNLNDTPPQTADRDELLAIIRQQAELIKSLVAEVKSLREELRKASRQAAPFSKGKSKSKPQRSGRVAGQGNFVNRRAPEVSPDDQVQNIEAPLDQKECPQCRTPLEVHTETATVEEAPAKPVRLIKIFRVQVGRCPICGRKMRGRHPDLPQGQHGVTAHRLGANVLGQALSLHYHCGLPLRKVPQVMAMCTGIELTQSALTQRAGALCAPQGTVQRVYQGLRTQIGQSKVVNTDDTGWRTGGQPSFLMGFFTSVCAVFQIRDRHRQEEVLEVLGQDFKGKLGTDRGKSYDAAVFNEVKQQKCLSHLLKNLSQILEDKRGRARVFALELKDTLREALSLWQEYSGGKLSLEQYRHRGKKVQEKLTYQLRDRVLSDADNQRLLDGIGMQHDRGRVLLFLECPEIEPTNNRAERGLRPAVIARKVSHCSKNNKGDRTYEAMKSVATTLFLRGKNVAEGLAGLIKGCPLPN